MKKPLFPVSSLLRVTRHLVGFSRREVRGFGVLLAGMTLLVVLPALVSHWLLAPATPVAATTTADDVRALDRVAAKLEQAEQVQRRARYAARDSRPWELAGSGNRRRWASEAGDRFPDRRSRYDRAEAPVAQIKTLTSFDPNALSALDWQRRGVPADVARRIVSYGRKAGGYRYREQLERIHGLEPAMLARLTPFLQLPSRAEAFGRPAGEFRSDRPATATAGGSSAPPATGSYAAAAPRAATPGYVRKPRVVQPFDLNTADTLTLMQLRGIGQRRAARIVELREKLGGFVSTAQLADVWGIEPALVDSLAKYGHIAPDFQPRPLALNSASVEELKAHPYVGPRLARLITAFRDQHGPFARPEDLRQIRVLEESTYQKLQPYLALR
ncbi:MAG: helix-hairpin-helix domain-containing protein [Hymenobacteraceae bacterium]|nr:helix-hairpin-helix domain-containing protein [Hymenobacteraceae bacterium]